ncbi:PTS sugar transporter subunit IIA, partial [Klebsiella pneumoniae]|uniref:PTS sugar transporter subunit IIA n=3 Tax=Klebsiella pneumoniae TaxID=573 RepID=UPI003AAD900C
LMMSLWDALRMNMMISYQELVRTFLSLVVLEKPIPFADSEKADIVIMFGARDSNAHIEEGIRSIVALLDNNDTMAKLRTARSREEVVALL